MRFWLVVHEHQYGDTTFAIEADIEPDSKILERFLEDFNPDRDWVTVQPLDIYTMQEIMGDGV